MYGPEDGRETGRPLDQDGGTAFGHEEELTLIDDDERLPWLESGEEPEDRGVDTGRILVFAGVLLFALIALIGGLIWFTRGNSPGGDATVADGNVIEAPAGPYKVRPTDPGGKQVEGTGDTSFEVAEGKTVEGKIAPAPSSERTEAPEPGFAEAPPAASGGVGVQVGAYASREAAQRGWDTLTRRYEVLSGRNHRVVEAVVDGSTVYRLQAVAENGSAADSLCQSIKTAGGDCQVKR